MYVSESGLRGIGKDGDEPPSALSVGDKVQPHCEAGAIEDLDEADKVKVIASVGPTSEASQELQYDVHDCIFAEANRLEARLGRCLTSEEFGLVFDKLRRA